MTNLYLLNLHPKNCRAFFSLLNYFLNENVCNKNKLAIPSQLNGKPEVVTCLSFAIRVGRIRNSKICLR